MDCYLTRVVAHLRRASVRPNRRLQGQQYRHGKPDLARRVNQEPRKRRARAPCCASASSRYPKADKDFL